MDQWIMDRSNRACQSYQLSGRSGSDTGAFQPDFRPLFFVPRSVVLRYFALHHVALMAVQQGRPPGFSIGPGNPLMASRSFDMLRMSRGLRRSFPKVRVSGDFCQTSAATPDLSHVGNGLTRRSCAGRNLKALKTEVPLLAQELRTVIFRSREPLNKSVTWVIIPTRRSCEGRNLKPCGPRFLPAQERRTVIFRSNAISLEATLVVIVGYFAIARRHLC